VTKTIEKENTLSTQYSQNYNFSKSCKKCGGIIAQDINGNWTTCHNCNKNPK